MPPGRRADLFPFILTSQKKEEFNKIHK